jgi:hypothetical protein
MITKYIQNKRVMAIVYLVFCLTALFIIVASTSNNPGETLIGGLFRTVLLYVPALPLLILVFLFPAGS